MAHGAELVHGPRKSHGAMAADQAVSGAQAGDSAERGGCQDGAGSFRADREGYQTGGNGATRSARRTARPARAIPWIEAGAKHGSAGNVVPTATGQLHHGKLADEHGAGLVEFLQHGGVVVEYLAGVGPRAPSGWLAGCAQEIFRAKRNALKHSAGAIALELFIDEMSAFDSGGGEGKRERVVARPKLFETLGEGPNQLDGREFASLQLGIQLGDGGEEDVVGKGGHQALN